MENKRCHFISPIGAKSVTSAMAIVSITCPEKKGTLSEKISSSLLHFFERSRPSCLLSSAVVAAVVAVVGHSSHGSRRGQSSAVRSTTVE